MNKYFACCLLLVLSASVNAGTITTYSDVATFHAAVNPTTLEDFTDSSHFPIPGGSLSSTTSFGTLLAGDIQPGATYTTPVGTGNYFNIDAGGGFMGGFLNGFNPSDRDLTITYSPLVAAFGFETTDLMPAFDIVINFVSGSSYAGHFTGIIGREFFGFQSDAYDIQSVIISGNNSYFGFAIDNHAFGGHVSTVPVPAAVWLFGSALIGLFGMESRRKNSK